MQLDAVTMPSSLPGPWSVWQDLRRADMAVPRECGGVTACLLSPLRRYSGQKSLSPKFPQLLWSAHLASWSTSQPAGSPNPWLQTHRAPSLGHMWFLLSKSQEELPAWPTALRVYATLPARLVLLGVSPPEMSLSRADSR